MGDNTFSSSLAALKIQLRRRFPHVKSAHLTEAFAVSLGFKSHAALLAAAQHATPLNRQPDSTAFRAWLSGRGYELREGVDLGFAEINGLPSEFVDLLHEARKLEDGRPVNFDALYAVRRQCAEIFGRQFGLGQREPRDEDASVVVRLSPGIDHDHSVSDWGRLVNTHNPRLEFPAMDHSQRFVSYLPLSGGKSIQVTTAIASMPYADSTRFLDGIVKVDGYAKQVGWHATVLPQWSWYANAATTLILYRRTELWETTERKWDTSFKRWLVENRTRLAKGSTVKRQVVADMVECQHFPLDVESFDDACARYFRQFAGHIALDRSDDRSKAIARLFAVWRAEAAH